MSALPRKADIQRMSWHVLFVPRTALLRDSPIPLPVLGARGVFGTRARGFPPFSLVPVPVLLSIFPPVGRGQRERCHVFQRFNAGAPSNSGSHPSAYLEGHRSTPVEVTDCDSALCYQHRADYSAEGVSLQTVDPRCNSARRGFSSSEDMQCPLFEG